SDLRGSLPPAPAGRKEHAGAADLAGGPRPRRARHVLPDAWRADLGARPDRIRYVVRSGGLACEVNGASLVISRAVLHEVTELTAIFRDMAAAMTPGAVAVHQVSLRSSWPHPGNPLEFLTWPGWLWSLMHSAKGVPNRARPGAYRGAAARAGLEVAAMK